MLTKKQQLEKENLEWFSPSLFKKWPPQEGEFAEYLAHSERGEPIGKVRGEDNIYGLKNVYSEAKRWRGITIHELWEDSFYSGGWWPGLHELLREEDGTTPIPEHIKNYISREIFGGQDKDKIDKIYDEICQTYLGNNGGTNGQTSNPNN